MNPKLFLNHTNRFYTLFLSRTFASETLSYFLSSPCPSTSGLGQRYTSTTWRTWGGFFQVPKDWEMGLRVVWDEFFLILLKFLDWETVLGTLGDVLKTRIRTCAMIPINAVRCCINMDTILGRLRLSTIYPYRTYLGIGIIHHLFWRFWTGGNPVCLRKTSSQPQNGNAGTEMSDSCVGGPDV